MWSNLPQAFQLTRPATVGRDPLPVPGPNWPPSAAERDHPASGTIPAVAAAATTAPDS